MQRIKGFHTLALYNFTFCFFPAFSWVLSLWLVGWLVVSRVCLLSRVSVSVRVRAGPSFGAGPSSKLGPVMRVMRLARLSVRPSVRMSVRLFSVPYYGLVTRKENKKRRKIKSI